MQGNSKVVLVLFFSGLPNELSVFWQQYPWILGLGLCKIRAYISEMYVCLLINNNDALTISM